MFEAERIFAALRAGKVKEVSAEICANPGCLRCKDASGALLAHLGAVTGILELAQDRLSLDILELTDLKGWTTVHFAAASGNLSPLAETFKLHPHLLSWESLAQETPVHVAARAASLSQIDWQRHYSALSHPNSVLESPAHIAARLGDFDSIAAFVTPELLMLRDISGTPVLDDVLATAEFKEKVPPAVLAEACRRLGRWEPEEMMLWMMGRAVVPAPKPQPRIDRMKNLLEVALQIRKVEDIQCLEELLQLKKASSAADLRQRAAASVAQQYATKDIDDALALLENATARISILKPGRVVSAWKEAARATLGELTEKAAGREASELAGALVTAGAALGKLRARQREIYCEHLAQNARYTSPGDAAQRAQEAVRNELHAKCPQEWLADPLACLGKEELAEVGRVRGEHQQLVREHYFQIRSENNKPFQAFELAERHLMVQTGRDFASSPVSAETLEHDYTELLPQGQGSAAACTGNGAASQLSPPLNGSCASVDWGAEDHWDEVIDEGSAFSASDIKDLDALVGKLNHPTDSLSRWLRERLSDGTRKLMAGDYMAKGAELGMALADDLTRVVGSGKIYNRGVFPKKLLKARTLKRANDKHERNLAAVNRRLLSECFSRELTNLHTVSHKYGVRLIHVAAAYQLLPPTKPEMFKLAAQSNADLFSYALQACRQVFKEDSCAEALYRQNCDEPANAKNQKPRQGQRAETKKLGCPTAEQAKKDWSFVWMGLRNPEGKTAEEVFMELRPKASNSDVGLTSSGERISESVCCQQCPTVDAIKGLPGFELVCHWYLPVVIIALQSCKRNVGMVEPSDAWEAALGAYGDKCANYMPCKGKTLAAFAWHRIQGAVKDRVRQRGILSGYMYARKKRIEEVESELRATLGRKPALDELADELRGEFNLSAKDGEAAAQLRKIMVNCSLSRVSLENDALTASPDLNEVQRREHAERVEAVVQQFGNLAPLERTVLLLELMSKSDPSVSVEALAVVLGWKDGVVLGRRAEAARKKFKAQALRKSQER